MLPHFAGNPLDEEVYLAGRRTPPGSYRELGTGRIVELTTEDTLPASLDGRVACYVRIASTWSQITARSASRRSEDGSPVREGEEATSWSHRR